MVSGCFMCPGQEVQGGIAGNRLLRRRLSRLLIGLLLATALLWLLLRDQDFSAVVQAIQGIELYVVVLCLAFLAASLAIKSPRWRWMLRPLSASLSFGSCVGPFLMSVAVNSLIPFRAGDAYRIIGFRKQLGATGSQVLGTVISERLLDLLVILSFLLFGLYGLTDNALPQGYVDLVVVIVLTVLSLGLGGVLLFPWLQRLVLRLLPGRFSPPGLAATDKNIDEIPQGRIAQLLHALHVLRRPGMAIPLLGLSMVSWIFSAAIYGIVAAAITGQDVGPVGAGFTLATANLGTLLPGAPANLGTFDYFAAVGLIAYGATRTAAVAFAFTVHIILWLPTTLVGAAFFVRQMVNPLPEHLAGGWR